MDNKWKELWVKIMIKMVGVEQNVSYLHLLSTFTGFLQRLSRDTLGGIKEVWLCLCGAHCVTPEEAQAAISPQPLFAPKNEPLQDNEHFKDRYSHNTNESPVKTLCSRQGRRERGSVRGGESAGSVRATLSVSGSGRNSSCCH